MLRPFGRKVKFFASALLLIPLVTIASDDDLTRPNKSASVVLAPGLKAVVTSKLKRVLSFDGCDFKGRGSYVPALRKLRDIEEALRKPTYEIFDLILATGEGARIACHLTTPAASGKPISAADLLSALEGASSATVPKPESRDIKLSDLLGKLSIATYDHSAGKLRFFNSWETSDKALPTSEIISAATTRFEGVGARKVDTDSEHLVLSMNERHTNPSLFVTRLVRKAFGKKTYFSLISLGAGKAPSKDLSGLDEMNAAKREGYITSIRAEDGGTDDLVRASLVRRGHPYFRFNPAITHE